MAVSKALFNVGKFILNRGLGLMTNRQISATTLTVGRRLTDVARKNGNISTDVIESIFVKSMPKGLKPPKILSSEEQLKEFFQNNLWLPKSKAYLIDDFLNATKNSALAVTVKTPKSSAIYLGNSISKSNENLINGVTHEFRHYLDFNFTTPNTISYFVKKLPSIVKTLIALPFAGKTGNFYRKYLSIQQKILSGVNLANPTSGIVLGKPTDILKTSNKKVVKYFRKILREESKGMSKGARRMFLSQLRTMIKTENSAYSQGGRVARLFAHPGVKGESPSEIIAFCQKQCYDAINLELLALKKFSPKTIRSFNAKRCRRAIIPAPKPMKKVADFVSNNNKGVQTHWLNI